VESLDPLMSLRHLSNGVGADGLLPPGFLFPVKEQVACMARPMVGWLKDHPFLYESTLSTIWR